MSDGRRFFKTTVRENWDSWNTDVYGVKTREVGDIPGILVAKDVFVQELDERGDVRFVIKNPSKPYLREI